MSRSEIQHQQQVTPAPMDRFRIGTANRRSLLDMTIPDLDCPGWQIRPGDFNDDPARIQGWRLRDR